MGQLKVDCIRHEAEVAFCVDMYMAQVPSSYMPVSRSTTIRTLGENVRRKKYFRVLRDDKRIVAWIYCELGRLLQNNYDVFQQAYYTSNLQGYAAFRALKLMHEDMFEFSRTQAVDFCISSGGPFDESNRFSKCLEKIGWTRHGHTAFRPVTPDDPTALAQVGRF